MAEPFFKLFRFFAHFDSKSSIQKNWLLNFIAIKSLENAHFEMTSNSGSEELTFTFDIIIVLQDSNFWLPTAWNLR